MKACPHCKLVNLDTAHRCECGYDFDTKSIDELSPSLHSARRWARLSWMDFVPLLRLFRNIRGWLDARGLERVIRELAKEKEKEDEQKARRLAERLGMPPKFRPVTCKKRAGLVLMGTALLGMLVFARWR